MGTWNSLHIEHGEIFIKVNLLEKALMNVLQKNMAEQTKGIDEQKDFLDAFKQGITLHFTVEKEALFPEVIKMGQTAKTLVDELLLQHQSIMEKYSLIVQGSGTNEEKVQILLDMAKELAVHAQKEERYVYPIVKQMSLEQLKEVDLVSKRLGYQV